MTPPVPPDGYVLIEYTVEPNGNGTFKPSIPVDAFETLQVWIPDLGKWMKPEFICGHRSGWYAMKRGRE